MGSDKRKHKYSDQKNRKHQKDKKKIRSKKKRYSSSESQSSKYLSSRSDSKKSSRSSSGISYASRSRSVIRKQKIKEKKSNRDQGRRSRTRSVPKMMRRYALQNTDTSEPSKYWDGFQWVVRTNSFGYQDTETLAHTRKMRRIQIGNLPIYLGLNEKDIGEIVTKFIMDNYLMDPSNTKPVLFCQHAPSSNGAILELSSVEETNRLVKLEYITLFDEKCRVQKVVDGSTPSQNLINVQANLQQSAQAIAAGLAAIEMICTQERPAFQLGCTITPPSKIIKISNIILQEKIGRMTEQQFQDTAEDVYLELAKYGGITDYWIIKPYQACVGGKYIIIQAQQGTMFCYFKTVEESQSAFENMNGRKFDGNELKIVYIKENLYNQTFVLQKEIKCPLQYR